ncbi:hypothetical protein RDI58_027419 [Solanum bulbocastanum]|uniref:Uncharacterized protein n=1 Tax=Solanum bulbocastanum TaxID=147425 RepID=A0AAN8SVB4_SOLBU
MDCEIIRNVDVPSAYVGLRILLVDPDTTSLSNIAAILEEHSFKERPEKKRRNLKWTEELDKKLDEVVRELGDKAGPKNVLERMCVQDLTKECLTYRLKKYRSQKGQAPVVQSVTSNEEHHSNVLNSSNYSADVNELFEGADMPQPPEVPSIANLPSSNDYSLNECDDWINEFLGLDDFELKLS